jgi:putative RNA 2'-phosphotransferase
VLDPNGWTDTAKLIERMNAQGAAVTMAVLEKVVETNDKKRFAFNDDKTKIRASQGHSVSVDLGLAPQKPPEFLFHGTAERFLESIKATGLAPQSRQHVHLSDNGETAIKVGSRHGKPVVLSVNAGAMHEAGHAFYRSENGVWLTDNVPLEHITFPERKDPNVGASTDEE